MSLVTPVVGIGASAGGLEAASKLLSRLPPDTGMAFVVIQHLDPARESLLPNILQKMTAMPVSQAVEGMLIVPDKVYVIAPGTHMVIDNRRLRLVKRPRATVASSVDCFLASLAEQLGNRAVAVILSGTASDGASGVKAVKAEGGIVFAQDERSAAFFSMPRSAIATGSVDFVLPPERIAAELAALARHAAGDLGGIVEDASGMEAVFLVLRRETGVDFSVYKPATIRRRMLRRMMLNKVKDLRGFIALLKKSPPEVQALHDDLLIHVTHFFRETKGLAALRAKALPRILKGLPKGAPLRIWVPGCSTGEEAYTLAIMSLDVLGERDGMNPVQVFATDISEAALDRARLGVYAADIQKDIPPRLLRRFFNKVERGYEVVRRVRDSCVFARQDLTKDPHFGNMHIISCCNVLIYLSAAAQSKIIPTFHYALRPGGALLLGGSESAAGFTKLFAPADKARSLYFKNSGADRSRPAAEADGGAQAARRSSPDRRGALEPDVEKAAERILLSHFTPAGVIVDDRLEVLHFRGNVSLFLQPNTGRANLDLLKMLPPLASSVVRSLIQRARKSDAPCRSSGLELSAAGDARTRMASAEAVPFRLPGSRERYYIVLFKAEVPSPGPKASKAKRSPESEATQRRLELELSATREHVQALTEEHEGASEELKAANEEIISSNEELQSTNEELEVAKEELQAANEELSTVNDELQSRNGELGLLNDDLLNIINAVHLPIVVVSADMRIRRFSPMAEKVMSLASTDVGRHLGDIRVKLPLPNIEEIIDEVVKSSLPKELELRDTLGGSYSLRIRPYRSSDSQVKGALLVFIDNDPIIRSIMAVKDVSAFEGVLDIADGPLAVLDLDLRVKAASRSMYQAFGLTPSSLGLSIFECGDRQWDVPGLRRPLETLASVGKPFSKVKIKVGPHRITASARRILPEASGAPLVLLALELLPKSA